MIKQKDKEKIIKEYKINDVDTGSDEVQIALFSREIKNLLSHLKKHPKDLHSKKGLLNMISKRRKLLKNLKGKNEKKYNAVISKIGLKK